MRKLYFLILTALAATLLSSCSTVFYQVYRVVPVDKLKINNNHLIYEDENCVVSYNFWSEGGNVGFQLFNKTDKNIYLNLEESFFIFNGTAYDYYKNRVFTNSSSSSASASKSTSSSTSLTGINYLDLLQTNKVQVTNNVGLATATGFSVSYNEKKVICIPPKSSKTITEYNISESLYRDCFLFLYPTQKEVKSKYFTIDDSPIIFSNRIAYTIGQSDNLVRFENNFYIGEIANYPEDDMFELRNDEFCDQKSTTSSYYFKDKSPDKFYIKYIKGQDNWTH